MLHTFDFLLTLEPKHLQYYNTVHGTQAAIRQCNYNWITIITYDKHPESATLSWT